MLGLTLFEVFTGHILIKTLLNLGSFLCQSTAEAMQVLWRY